ncbi:hypothetical protein QUB80_11280 [Chlorogloeopsis sp. ULAP01]|uniref:hypothetical protein n=1 Tax=Chlorogloeopsis sp. ULAP01 TaxID=3056483 RepID=UPI0025AB274E|nr:hypothetical protein [Chlorogloeopsis sp. ULAP01]MDM9381286.1 hypothetical protein [Chlorogloeopsis sp. ULAP01]
MADLSGTWLGTYWQEGIPTRFEAVLVQSGNSLSGNILDDNFLGEAQLHGEVIGRRISFTKSYLTTSPDPVKYVGTISEDENYMQGEWRISKHYSGSWEARRSGESLTAELVTSLAKQELIGFRVR